MLGFFSKRKQCHRCIFFLPPAPPLSQLKLLASTSWVRPMGGGPRTFPGGVNKWQWKRMKENKQKEMTKRRLTKEKQLYELRQRAEVLAKHPELIQPWEKLIVFPSGNVTPDQQVDALVKRFDRPTGEDLWKDEDGPQLSRKVPIEEPATPLVAKFPEGLDPLEICKKEPKKKAKRDMKLSTEEKGIKDYFDSFVSNPLGVPSALKPKRK